MHLGKEFKLNAYRMIFGIKHKVGNYVLNLGIFLWSKAIRVSWTTCRLLTEGKPFNEMKFSKQNVEIEYFAALEQPNRREIPEILVFRRDSCHVQRCFRNDISTMIINR